MENGQAPPSTSGQVGGGEISKAINSSVKMAEDVAVHLVMGYLESQSSFFAFPIVETITQSIVTLVLDIVFNKLKLGMLQLADVIQTAEEEHGFNLAAHNFNKDPSDKNKAAFLDAARSFGQFITP